MKRSTAGDSAVSDIQSSEMGYISLPTLCQPYVGSRVKVRVRLAPGFIGKRKRFPAKTQDRQNTHTWTETSNEGGTFNIFVDR